MHTTGFVMWDPGGGSVLRRSLGRKSGAKCHAMCTRLHRHMYDMYQVCTFTARMYVLHSTLHVEERPGSPVSSCHPAKTDSRQAVSGSPPIPTIPPQLYVPASPPPRQPIATTITITITITTATATAIPGERTSERLQRSDISSVNGACKDELL